MGYCPQQYLDAPGPGLQYICPADAQNGLAEQAGGHILTPHVAKLGTERVSVWLLRVWEAWIGPGQPCAHPTVPKL